MNVSVATLIAFGMLAGLLSLGASPVQALPGDLDLSFAGTGVVADDYGPGDDVVLDMAVQPDGKVIAVGFTRTAAAQLALARYLSDGTPDASFGTGGIVVSPVGAVSTGWSVALQPDGKIVVAGSWSNGTLGHGGGLIARFDADGTLDAAFGSGGVVTPLPSGANEFLAGVAVQPDGKILVAGHTDVDVGDLLLPHILMQRLDAGGAPDPSFGGGGTALATTVPLGARAHDLGLLPDGRIVIAGTTFNGIDFDFVVTRHLANGALDASFGIGGFAVTNLGGNDQGWGLAVQPDGRVVAAGSSDNRPALVRHLTDGQLDPSFGGAGAVVTTRADLTNVRDVALEPDGKLVVALWQSDKLAVARYRTDGTLDLGFGCKGVAAAPLGPSGPEAIALTGDGDIVGGGVVGISSGGDILLARFAGGSVPVDCGNAVLDPGEECDDGNLTDGDCCTSCRRPCGCVAAGKSLLAINDAANDAGDKLLWKWLKGGALTQDDIADPRFSGGYQLCMSDGAGSVLTTSVPAGSLWDDVGGAGFAYKDPLLAHAGIKKVLIKSGAAGRPKAILTGKGVNLPDPTLGSFAFPLNVELLNIGNDSCLKAAFDAGDVITNTTQQLKAKSD